MLSSVNILASNEFDNPISITMFDDGVISAKQPHIRVKVSDILGKPLPKALNVVANTVTKDKENVAVVQKKNLEQSSTDK